VVVVAGGLPQRVGPYVVQGVLGQGGMGTVLRARHEDLDVMRALKVLTSRQSPTGAARFAREVAALASVRHPNVVGIHDSGEVGGLPWYAMDLIEGEPLDRILERGGALPLDRALEVTIGICEGVEALHRAGVVHRDLKPQNVVITSDGRPVVLDLGLAIAPDRDQRLTKTGAMVGTPNYMAPEQLAAAPVSARTDVHALGLILFELVTGRVALVGGSVHDLMGKILSDERPRASELLPDLPVALDRVLARAMAREVAERHASAAELAAELAALRAAAGGGWAGGRRVDVVTVS
jgi:serine/threonine protein kinase